MNQQPIDVTKIALRTLRFLDDGRRAVEDQWRRITDPPSSGEPPPADRRKPPEIW